MQLFKVSTFVAALAAMLRITHADTISVSFYTEPDCNLGYIETRTVAVNECFALTDDTWFGSYLVPSSIPDSLLNQALQLEAGDTNPVDCSVGRCVELSTTLGCQPALDDGEMAWWFGMFW